MPAHINSVVVSVPRGNDVRGALMARGLTSTPALPARGAPLGVAPVAYGGRRVAVWAAGLFLAPYFISSASIGLTKHVLPSRSPALLALAILALAIVLRGGLAVGRVAAGVLGLGVLVLGYEISRGVPEYGFRDAYLAAGFGFVVIYGLTVVYGALFFDRRAFVTVFYWLSITSAWVAIAAWGLDRLANTDVLVNRRETGGGDRLVGLLAEPSAWAPIVPVLIILGLRRRYPVLPMLTAAIVTYASQSPTVYLVTVTSLILYSLLTTKWSRGRVPALVLTCVVVVGGTYFVTTANAMEYVASTNRVENAVGRLLLGFESIQRGDGDPAVNARLSSTQLTVSEVDDLEIYWVGYGPNSSSVYFPAKYPAAEGVAPGPNAIWVRALFEGGVPLAAALVTLLALAVIRVRHYSDLAAIFLPVTVAVMINSAGGHDLNKLAVLGLLLFAFGWFRGDAIGVTNLECAASAEKRSLMNRNRRPNHVGVGQDLRLGRRAD